MPGYLITLDPAQHDVAAIHALLRTTYWSPGIRRDVVQRALAGSITAVALERSTGQTVGLARVVTDRATFAWLCDVFVAEPHCGLGLSNRLLDALEAHPDLQHLRRWCLATRDAHGLYQKRGYQPVVPGAWMERKAPPAAWQESPADG